MEIAVNGRPTASVDMRYVRSDSAAPFAATASAMAPTTAPAMAPVGFVNVEPGVSIVADAITASVMRAVEPAAAAPMPATGAAPEMFAATLEAAPTTAPAPTTPMEPVTITPETFAPKTVTAAPETFSPPTMTAAPETVAPSVISTPEPTEPIRTTVEGDVPDTGPDADELNSDDNAEPQATNRRADKAVHRQRAPQSRPERRELGKALPRVVALARREDEKRVAAMTLQVAATGPTGFARLVTRGAQSPAQRDAIEVQHALAWAA